MDLEVFDWFDESAPKFRRIVGYGISGCDPNIMGIGPVPAIRAMMAKTGRSLADVDQLEINEAFGAQALSCLKELDAVSQCFGVCRSSVPHHAYFEPNLGHKRKETISRSSGIQVPMEKFNTCGGAIAIGHPLAASGARISGHVVHKLRQNGQKLGVGSACIGGGQGIAIMFEKC